MTSHVSGTTSDLGHHVIEGFRGDRSAWPMVGFGLLLLSTFLIGAVISGVTTELARRRGWESIYVLPMALQAALLAFFAIGVAWALSSDHQSPLWRNALAGLASVAMGVQNATITRISSGVVRTTHVTGVITDLGLELVQFFWRAPEKAHHTPHAPHAPVAETSRWTRLSPQGRRLALLVSIIGSFALGAALGTATFEALPAWAMCIPVLFLIWIVYQDLTRPIAEIEPSDLVEARDLALPEGLLIFHVRRDKDHAGGVQRLPNLLAWSERLPVEAKVVILDLTDVTQLDANAAYELRAALDRFEQQGRRLVVAGVTRDQYEQLRKAGTGERLDPNSACPDLELAIARGMVLLP